MKIIKEDNEYYCEFESLTDILKVIAVAIIGSAGFVLLWVFIDLLA